MNAAVHERLHALDAARAFALLLGIALHATMSFFLPIPAQDSSQSSTLAGVFFVIHSFRMSLFFVIAGFFAHLAFHRRGARGFVKDRALRIVVPMTVGWVLLAPLTLAILVWGVTRAAADSPMAGSDGAASAPAGMPLTHLWFLYYLCLLYVLVLAIRAGFVRLIDRAGVLRARLDRLLAFGLTSHLAPMLLALPLFAVLYPDPDWPLWFGIPTPDTGFTPQLPALTGFGTAFVLGWLLHRQTGLLSTLGRQWWMNLALASALTIACLAMVGVTPDLTAPAGMAGGHAVRGLYAAAYTVSIWCWVFGLIGAAVRFCSRASALRRYLADASYFLYLAHLPVVFALQVLVAPWPLHWSLKFTLIVAVTLAVLLTCYHVLVRPTVIGEILNGRRHSRRGHAVDTAGPTHDQAPGSPPDSACAAVARLAGVSKRYGQTVALDDLSIDVRRGELLALLGPNGAGKSTALGVLLGTLQPDSGEVSLLGGSPLDVVSRLGIGVMMQEVSLAPMLSAREHIALASSCYRNPLTVAQTIALTGIEAFADRRHGQLSGGQKRQVQFAVAVCGRPRLLFLDEPTTGLDVQARAAIWRTIRALLDDGCSIVLTTHYLEEAQALADRVAVLAKGRRVAQGSVDAMRALVACRHIRCDSALDAETIRRWPGVVEVVRTDGSVSVTAADAESVVRRLLDADPHLSQLEVRQASLAEALNELTREAA